MVEGEARCRASARWSPPSSTTACMSTCRSASTPRSATGCTSRRRSRSRIRAGRPDPYNTRLHARPAADADQQPGDGLAPGGRASRARRLPLLRAQAGSPAPLLHRRTTTTSSSTRLNTATESRRSLGHPVAHSLRPGCRTRPSRGRARLGVRAARRPAGGAREQRCGRSSTRTSPRRTSSTRARALGSELPSVNTIVRGRRASRPTPRSSSKNSCHKPAIVGDGGAAAAFRHALPEARVFSRRGEWPPDVSDADSSSTRRRCASEVLFELGPGTDADRPARIRARRRRRPRPLPARASSTGSRCSSPRARRASSSGPVVRAPVDVMRRAVGLT